MKKVSEGAGHEANAAQVSDGTQENLIFCAHRGHGCISQNGYTCTHGPKCEPMDNLGRKFVVFEWIEDGQRLATRRYLTGGEITPVIDADTMQAQAEARVRQVPV